jgi:hypothetical protein
VISRDDADSMRESAKRLEAWASSVTILTAPELEALPGVLRREAARLRADAAQLDPTNQAPRGRNQGA